MSKFGIKNIWDIKGGGSTPVDTSNLAKLNATNTFTGKNTFQNIGDIVTIKTTDNNSGGVDFKQANDTRIGYLGGSQNNPDKMTLWGKNGLILQANGQNVEVNSGAGALTYTSTNTSKNSREVLVRNDMYYVKKADAGSFTCNANDYQTAQYTINGLTTGLNEFYIVFTTSNVDIGFDLKIQCNNLNYQNQSEVKVISTSNFTNSNVDNLGLIYVGFVIYENNKIRFRMKNTHSSNITFTGFRVYHRIPGKITG